MQQSTNVYARQLHGAPLATMRRKLRASIFLPDSIGSDGTTILKQGFLLLSAW